MDEVYVNVCSPPAPGERRPGGPVQPPRAANACSGLCSGSWSSRASLDRLFPLCLGLLFLAPLTRLLVSSISFHLSEAECGSANLTVLTDGSLPGSGDRDPLARSPWEGDKKLQESCPDGWECFRGFCYLFSSQNLSWGASRLSCRRARADLAVVDTPEEQNFLAGRIRWHTWIGLTDRETEGTWKWVDRNPRTYWNWWPPQPDDWMNNEDCGHLTFSGQKWILGKWNDDHCNKCYNWICKKKLG